MQDKPQYISVENGQPHMINELFDQGYRRFKFVNQAKIHEISLCYPAKEGQYVDYNFPFGSSGPFGEEIDLEWIDRDAVLRQSESYWENPNRDGKIHGWFDLHASI